MIPIDKGIPLPALRKSDPDRDWKKSGRYKYPWTEMEVGDSFLSPKRPCLSIQSLMDGRRYTQRKVNKGYRVWRIE
jgi:hypothetical protein